MSRALKIGVALMVVWELALLAAGLWTGNRYLP